MFTKLDCKSIPNWTNLTPKSNAQLFHGKIHQSITSVGFTSHETGNYTYTATQALLCGQNYTSPSPLNHSLGGIGQCTDLSQPPHNTIGMGRWESCSGLNWLGLNPKSCMFYATFTHTNHNILIFQSEIDQERRRAAKRSFYLKSNY